MKWLVLGLILAIAVVFWWQNQQPVVLVLFGLRTSQLPLAAWVLIFILAGLLTSLCLRLLLGTTVTPKRESTTPKRKTVVPRYREEPEIGLKQPPVPSQFSPPNPPETTKESKAVEGDDDWLLEKPSQETKSLRDDERSPEPMTPSGTPVPPPHRESRQGTIYSYTYRESKKSNPEPVYDAKYRVITPSSRDSQGINPGENLNNQKDDDDDEEWV